MGGEQHAFGARLAERGETRVRRGRTDAHDGPAQRGREARGLAQRLARDRAHPTVALLDEDQDAHPCPPPF